MDFEGYLILKWTDKRIKYLGNNSKELLDLGESLKKIWTPDLWIKSLRHYKLHKNIQEQATIEINKENEIAFWQRYYVNTKYVCFFRLRSFLKRSLSL